MIKVSLTARKVMYLSAIIAVTPLSLGWGTTGRIVEELIKQILDVSVVLA
jgi:hypothetical protein